MKRFIVLSGYFNIIYGGVIFIFWMLYGLIFPFTEPSTSIIPLVSHPHWIWINSLGAFSIICGIIGLTGMFFVQMTSGKLLALIGFILAVAGLVIAAGQLFWEAYIWKILVQNSPDMLTFDGPIYTDTPLKAIIITGGVFFSAGYFLFGMACRSDENLSSWGLQLIAIGAPLFAFAPFFGEAHQAIRITGVVVFATGLILTGIKMIRGNNFAPETE